MYFLPANFSLYKYLLSIECNEHKPKYAYETCRHSEFLNKFADIILINEIYSPTNIRPIAFFLYLFITKPVFRNETAHQTQETRYR